MRSKLTHLAARFPMEPPDTRGRILQAAARLFTTHGYEGASTDAIARAAGVKPAGLYRQFESKEAILFAFLENVFEGFLADMEEAVQGVDDPAERLARLAWAHTWVQLTSAVTPAQVGTMFSVAQLRASLSHERAARLQALARAHLQHCRIVIEEGSRTKVMHVPDARSAALAITTMCEYAVLWFRTSGPLSVEEIADRYAMYSLRIVQVDNDDVDDVLARVTGRTRSEAG